MALAEIVEKFQLKADPTSGEDVVRALKKRLGELHPDRSGGNFASEESRQAFLDIQSTIDSIGATGALVPLKDVTALVESLVRSVAPLGAMQEENLRTQKISHIKESVKAHHHGMKLTSGTFLAISSGLLAFMGSLKDNPILSRALDIPGADIALLGAWIYSCMFFAVAWHRERRAEAYVDFLSTDEGLAYTFDRLNEIGLERLPSGHFAFTKQDLVRTISKKINDRRHPLSFSVGIGGAATQAIASSQIDKLMSRGVVSRSPVKGVREWFQIEGSAS